MHVPPQNVYPSKQTFKSHLKITFLHFTRELLPRQLPAQTQKQTKNSFLVSPLHFLKTTPPTLEKEYFIAVNSSLSQFKSCVKTLNKNDFKLPSSDSMILKETSQVSQLSLFCSKLCVLKEDFTFLVSQLHIY